MKKYAILTDSSCNLSSAQAKEFGIDKIVNMHVFFDGKKFDATSDWTSFTGKEYYDLIRSGKQFRTSQALSNEYEDAFRPFLNDGYDVLSLSCSKALSSSVSESAAAAKKLEKEFPDAKIYCIDTYNCCFSLAMLIKDVNKLRENGGTIDEARDFVLNNRGYYNEAGTVDDLTSLRNAGRVSGAAAFFGGVFSVKPIIVYDETGHNVVVEKVRGRKNSILRSAEYIAKYGLFDKNNTVYVAHGDCAEDAKTFANILQSLVPDIKLDFVYAYIESCIGSAVGPGTLIVDFYGDPAIRKTAK